VNRALSNKVLMMHLGGGIGGAPVSLLRLAERLDGTGYTPKIVFSQAGAMIDLAERSGVATGLLPMPGALVYGAQVPISPRRLVPALVAYRGTVAAARTLLRSERPDLVHLNTAALLPLGIAAKREGIPVVWHIREVVNPGTPVGRWLSRKIVNTADRVIAASQYVADGLPAREPGTGTDTEGNADQVAVIHNAVDTSRFDPEQINGAEIRSRLGIDESAIVVGILGSVQAVKGHFLLAEAARQLLTNHPNIVLMIVGGGAPEGYGQTWKGRLKSVLRVPFDHEERLARIVERNGTKANFRFCGYQADVAPFVAAMDVVVSPNLAPEGFGRPLIEAMAMAKPVVASDIGPSREILGDATAIFCPPGEPDTLARALTRLASDPEMARGMGRAGRERAVRAFNIDGHVQAVTDVYESVLGTHVAAPVRAG
jgi:glycosyltransferase involved in cell wall biosynthesis